MFCLQSSGMLPGIGRQTTDGFLTKLQISAQPSRLPQVSLPLACSFQSLKYSLCKIFTAFSVSRASTMKVMFISDAPMDIISTCTFPLDSAVKILPGIPSTSFIPSPTTQIIDLFLEMLTYANSFSSLSIFSVPSPLSTVSDTLTVDNETTSTLLPYLSNR